VTWTWRDLLLLVLLAAAFLFPALNLSFLDPDEGLYGAVAQEMLAGGDWVIPHLNGLPYLEKPPLYFWLTALTLGVVGPSEWAVRLWSALGALGSVLLVWRIGRRLYGPGAGLLAGLALATTAGYALYVRKASTDLLFVFCLTLALYGFLRDAESAERGWTRFLLLYLGAGLAVLAKGLIGLLFPALIVGLGLLWVRGLSLRDLNLWRGLLLFLAVVLPWHLAAAWRAPGLFWFYLVESHLLRFLDLRGYVEDDIPISTLGFLVATFLWAFPWGVFLLARARPGETAGARWRPLLILWVVVVVGFFALARFKHEYYALPALPAVALLVGGAWQDGRDIGRWLTVGLLGCLLVGGAALWAGAALTPAWAFAGLAELNVYYRILREQGAPFPFESARPFGLLLQGLGAALVVGWGLAWLSWARGWRRAAFGTLVGMAALIAGLIVQLLLVVEPHHSARAVAQAIVEQARPEDLVVYEGSLEYSPALPFYTGRRVRLVNGAVGYFEVASRLPEADGVFLDRQEFGRAWEGPARVFLVTRQPRERSVVATLPPGQVREVGRYGSRWLYVNR
jgi:4-amino-4-deoxy-L-arabinose transferase-like glycosyltransferase